MFSQRGDRGELRAGSYSAARFGEWSLVRPDDVLASDVATVDVEGLAVVDAFLFNYEDLDIWLDCGSAWWVWKRVVKAGGASWRTRGGKPEIRVKGSGARR